MLLLDRRQFLFTAASGIAASALPNASAASAVIRPHDILHLQVIKSKRVLQLISENKTILKSYPVRLGRSPAGPKRFQGDNRTPEGIYRINCRNPQSQFYLSLGINYPSSSDVAYARSKGRSPGGDIFIHGQPNGFNGTYDHDWTRGCVAVSNSDMEEVFSLIPIGCPIAIFA